MPEQSVIDGQLDLLKSYRQTISLQWQQFALHGAAHAPPGLLNGIHENANNIARIKDNLREFGETIEDQIDDTADPLRIQLQGHIPNQNRPVPDYYIERGDSEIKLIAALSDEQAAKLFVIYGLSGMGKTSTVAHVVDQVRHHYPSGVFWGDLADYTPEHQFLAFLLNSQNGFDYRVQEKLSSRETFWRLLAELESKVLVIFDNVSSPEQVQHILPAHPDGKYRIIIISLRPFEMLAKQIRGEPAVLLQHSHRQEMPAFTVKEAEAFFEKRLGHEKLQHYQKELTEISQRVEMSPHLVAAYAGEIADNRGSPMQYALKLRYGEGGFGQLATAVHDALEVLLANLSEDERDIFELTSVMGEGEWPIAMMSAVSLRPTNFVREVLQNLTRRNLVKIASADRYTTNAMIREYAEQRFKQRPIFIRHAAHQFLARYCLDIAQTLDAETAAPLAAFAPASVELFQKRVRPELIHVQRVLDWASQHEQWDVLLRFARVAHLELHEHLRANSFELRKTASLATFAAPVVRITGETRAMQVRCQDHMPGWQIQPNRGENGQLINRSQGTWLRFHGNGIPDKDTLRCELNTQLAACVITDGVFDTMCLVDSQWAGVRAPNIIFRHVDVVGSRFLACDFSGSIWAHCDARRVILQHSNMRNTLLRHVRMHGADLRGADFTGALLEDVDLRGADLREANFTNAQLDTVDLRGALLENTNFTAIEHRNLKLDGTRIDQSIWAGVSNHTLALTDPVIIQMFEELSAKATPTPLSPRNPRSRPLEEMTRLIGGHGAAPGSPPTKVKENLTEADLRAADLNGVQLSPQHILLAADLRAANLSEALLSGATLNKTQLRAADLSEAQLASARLYGADLSAANLHQANCAGTFLETAALRGAYLAGANFSGANLKNAQLQNSELYGTNFEGAVLEGANLSYVQANGMSAARFCNAKLSGAILDEGDFGGADFSGANLSGASCINASFGGATITAAQLAQAARLDGATLPDGSIVQVFSGEYNAESEWFADLRFAHFDGVLAKVRFSGRDLTGVHLDGRSRRSVFAGCDLSYARLNGKFRGDDFRGCTWAGAQLSGTFSEIQFGTADFSTASFADATLVNVDMSGATGLSDEQLKLAHSLHCVTLPDGIYDGRFNLPGDRIRAEAAGIDPNESEAIARFLSDPNPPFVQIS